MRHSLNAFFRDQSFRKRVFSTNDYNAANVKYVDSNVYIAHFRTNTVPPSLIYMGKRIVLEPFIQRDANNVSDLVIWQNFVDRRQMIWFARGAKVTRLLPLMMRRCANQTTPVALTARGTN